MKIRVLLIIFCALMYSNGFAQSDFKKTIRDSKEFRTIAEKLGLAPGSIHIIKTTYLIEADGSLSNITASSEYPELEPEAIRIIGTLPKHTAPRTPGETYTPHKITLPITYRVETGEQKKFRLRKEARNKKKT